MGRFLDFRYKRVSHSATVEDLVKELVRKSIHICAAFVPFFAMWQFWFTVIALANITVLYCIFELMRLKGLTVPVISKLTQIASRKRDEGKFVLGPVTLSIGVLISLLIFSPKVATVAVFSLAFGDGLASLIGKIYGQKHFSKLKKKTVAGSLACFFGVFLSLLFITRSVFQSFLIALITTIVEVIPLKDFDNILIPIVAGLFAMMIGI
ncbi:MAG: phosphatidate cytidylyltransferase [Treponema sp.]|nr:MAG: phosphatidate cytidylyltransferase [Treponema sp.]